MSKKAPKGKIILKIGGAFAADRRQLVGLCSALADLHRRGFWIALVHGGGKDINENLELLAEKPKFVNGLRVTDENVLDMVEMTLSGRVNKLLVSLLQRNGAPAAGISGVDGRTFVAVRKESTPDLGFVGEIRKVNTMLIETIWNGGFMPVVSPISTWVEGGRLNVNADDAASALARGLGAEQLLFVSDVAGVMKDEKIISELNESTIEELIKDGTISGGMIPKTKSCVESLQAGVKKVHIVGWTNGLNLIEQIEGISNRGSIVHA